MATEELRGPARLRRSDFEGFARTHENALVLRIGADGQF